MKPLVHNLLCSEMLQELYLHQAEQSKIISILHMGTASQPWQPWLSQPPLSPHIFLHHCAIDILMWGIKIHPGVNTVAQYYTFGILRSNPPGQPRVVSPSWTSNHLHQPPPGGRTLAIARLLQPPQDDFSKTVIWLVVLCFLNGIQSSRW